MTEDEEGVQVGTSQGWPQFCEWVDNLPDGDPDDDEGDEEPFGELKAFCEEGDAYDLANLADELREALKEDPPDEDVRSTARGVLAFLAANDGAEMVMVVNGMVDADLDGE